MTNPNPRHQTPRPAPPERPIHFLSIARIALGALFVYSGFIKTVLPYQNFLYVIESYELLSPVLAEAAAKSFPWIEFLAGFFLLTGLWTRLAASVLWILNSLFIGVLISALWRKLPIEDCGCFGGGIHMPLPIMLALDVVIWAVFFLIVTRVKKAERFGLDAWLGGRNG